MYVHMYEYICMYERAVNSYAAKWPAAAADQMETEWYFVMLPPPIEHMYVCVCVGSCICKLAYLHMYVCMCVWTYVRLFN